MKCLGCGAECPDTAKFCHNCGKPFLANHATEKNTDDKIIDDTPITNEPAASINKDDVPASDDLFGSKTSKTLIIFAVIAVVVIVIVVFSTIIRSAESQTTTRVFITSQTTTETTTEETTTEYTTRETTTKTASSSEPSEIELITYSETALKNYLSEPKFQFTEYYNVVETKGGLRAKVEGTVKDSNKNKHEYTMILAFDNSDYETYHIAYLQIDGVDLVG